MSKKTKYIKSLHKVILNFLNSEGSYLRTNKEKFYFFSWIGLSIFMTLEILLRFFVVKEIVNQINLNSIDHNIVKLFFHGVLLIVAINLLMFFASYFLQKVSTCILIPVFRERVAIKYLSKTINCQKFISSHQRGIIQGFLNDLISTIPEVCDYKFSKFIPYFFYVLFSLIFISLISPLSALISFFWLCSTCMIGYIQLYKKSSYAEKWAQLGSRINGKISDILQNLVTVKIFNQEQREISNLEKDYVQASTYDSKMALGMLRFNKLTYFIFLLFQLGALVLLLCELLQKQITSGDIFFVFFSFQYLFNATKNFFLDLERYQRLLFKCKKAQLYFNQFSSDMQTYKLTNSSTIDLKNKDITIKVSNLSFSYDSNNSPLIENLGLVIKKGNIYMIKGKSGVGKTTLIKLILGFLNPLSGSIEILGKSPSQAISEKKVFAMMQEQMLFDRTLYENISYDYDKASLDIVIDAAKKAFIYDEIIALPKNFQTTLGSPVQLSSGQKQRILLSRAFLKKYSVILLDEFTNHLDINLIQKISANLLALKNSGSTIIIVSHDPRVELYADKIIELNKTH
ncbi:MAG: hypothetical protein CMM87_00020 [Rickettsiales bacterium]|nr:hypothetical protein [Rickettsiales bacterium]